MLSLNDLILQIHMTFLNHPHSVEWVSSFKDDIAPLSLQEFDTLINMLEGVSEQEEDNYTQTIMYNNIPKHLQERAANTSNFQRLIDQLRIEYAIWQTNS